MIPTAERCREILKGPNFDVNPWTCPVCGEVARRAHWIAEHALEHMRKGEDRPKEPKVELKPGVRPIDLD